MAVGDRVDQFRALIRQAFHDLFDQSQPFGRLALVQVLMLAGDTLVTISLAGSLFFSISPDEAKGKVLLYLVITLAPFAVVSPLLGPLIDRSRSARRGMAVSSGVGRAVLCPFMAHDTHSLLLFPEAFLILVLSKLYLVTRGALVPEMATYPRTAARPGGSRGRHQAPPPSAPGVASALPAPALPFEGAASGPASPRAAGDPAPRRRGPRHTPVEFAALNARLTLLGTLAGFAASVPGVLLLKLSGSPAVLVFDAFVFAAGALAAVRLPTMRPRRRSPARPRGAPETPTGPAPGPWQTGRAASPLAKLQPFAHPEVLLGLVTMTLIRASTGFLVFLLAFGLRREHASLFWYGLALSVSGAGSLTGLLLVGRLKRALAEQQILLLAIWTVSAAALVATVFGGTLPLQVLLAYAIGLAGALAQPSFDALTQHFVPTPLQGRAFARFATRQQLAWVVGALIPVAVALPFAAGDAVIFAVAGAGGAFYVTSRRALHDRALVRRHDAAR